MPEARKGYESEFLNEIDLEEENQSSKKSKGVRRYTLGWLWLEGRLLPEK